jgi:aspartokinase
MHHVFIKKQVFGILERNQVSVDMVATSEVSVSFTLDPSKIWNKGELYQTYAH